MSNDHDLLSVNLAFNVVGVFMSVVVPAGGAAAVGGMRLRVLRGAGGGGDGAGGGESASVLAFGRGAAGAAGGGGGAGGGAGVRDVVAATGVSAGKF